MKRVLVSLLAAATLFACSEQQARTSASNGTLALTHDDALLYAVDGDNQFVSVVDAQKQERIATVKVGAQPEQILILPDDSAYVANRGDRSLSFFKRGDWENVKRIPVGVEPVGLALSRDGKQLLVVNEASLVNPEKGSLMAIDVASNQIKWELEVGRDPRGITVLSDTRALVSLYRPGDVVEVDLSVPKVTRGGTTLEADVNRDALNNGGFPKDDPAFQKSGVKPRAMGQLVATPDGEKVYGTVTWASTSVLNGGTPNGSSGGSTYGGGGASVNCGSVGGGSVAAAGIVTFQADSLQPQTDSLNECFSTEGKDYPATRLASPNGDAIQGPSAIVIDPTGKWLFVANRESNNVAIVPTARGSGTAAQTDFLAINTGVKELVTVGAFPTGLALSSDGRRLYVQNQFDHTIQILESSGAGTSARIQPTGTPIVIAGDLDTVPADVLAGRRLFFAANDSRMTGKEVGISCGSCHLDGREDGHVWNFVEGPRQTPSLAGRDLQDTAPYHWGGEHPNFDSFVNHTVGTRMGGTGNFKHEQLFAFINAMPTPDNPNQHAAPTEAQIRGAQVFQKATCNTCHAGSTYSSNTNADVGTFVRTGAVQDDLNFLANGLNTPSLLGLSRTAPYLHDGSAQTIKDRILQGKATNKHGQTAQLTDGEVDDLVEFLKSL